VERLTPTQLRVLACVLAGARSVRQVARRAGLSMRAAVRVARRLRAGGLVAWDDGRLGTLRPACRWIPAARLGRGKR
jgi:DNA-binding MarR family transcriptional regulator